MSKGNGAEGARGTSREQITYLAVASLQPPSIDVRQTRDSAYVERLAADIASRGIKHPIRVLAESAGKYEVLTGENRRRAALLAGLAEAPCIVVSETLSEVETLLEQLLENEHRRDVSDVERGEAYLRLMKLNGWTQAQLAEALDVRPGTVCKILKVVTSLSDDVRKLVDEGKLAYTAAAAIARISCPEKQKEIARKYADGLLSRDGVLHAVAKERPAKQASRSRVRAKTKDGIELSLPWMSADELVLAFKSLNDAVKKLVRHRLSVDALPDLLSGGEGAA